MLLKTFLRSALVLPGLLQAKVLPLFDKGNQGAWTLVEAVSDEFDEGSLDLSKWNNLGKDGNFHGEWKGRAPSQYNPENVTLKDGFLALATKWDPGFSFTDELLKGVAYGKPAPVTTAAIVSKTKFKYGYLEMRCRAASGPVSSSFWTTGKGGEIDVFEHFGSNPNNANAAYRYHTSFHDWRKGSPTFSERIWTNDHRLGFKVSDDFHVYGLEWAPDFLRIHVDGRLIRVVSREEMGDRWVATEEQKIWIDSELFEWEVNASHLKASDFGEKSVFLVDYCRVWQRGRGGAPDRVGPNLFGNASFEDGLKNWSGNGVLAGDAYAGKTCVMLKESGKIQQTVQVKPNTTYLLSAWGKSPETMMTGQWQNSYLNVAAYGGPKLGTSFAQPKYHRKSLEFTTGPEAKSTTVFFTNAPQGGLAFVDHFELVESSPPKK
ncbi:family 16 glycosylhydrolase [Akkermansiaceae bacterium]|nr:family 16 glycosylhydrolase [Akkermansiaceae bacterium]